MLSTTRLIRQDAKEVIAMVSCTTPYLAPVANVLREQCGIVHLCMTTLHAYAANQTVLDMARRQRRQSPLAGTPQLRDHLRVSACHPVGFRLGPDSPYGDLVARDGRDT